MAGGNRIEVKGLTEARRDMNAWATQVAPAVTQGSASFATNLAAKVAGKVPKVSGALAASVAPSPAEGGIGVSIGSGLRYAGWIEFGGSRGRPLVPEGRYLAPTALAAQDEFTQVAEKAADDTARRYPWSTSSK